MKLIQNKFKKTIILILDYPIISFYFKVYFYYYHKTK